MYAMMIDKLCDKRPATTYGPVDHTHLLKRNMKTGGTTILHGILPLRFVMRMSMQNASNTAKMPLQC